MGEISKLKKAPMISKEREIKYVGKQAYEEKLNKLRIPGRPVTPC